MCHYTMVVSGYTNDTAALTATGEMAEETVRAMYAGCKSAQASGSDSADYQLFMSGWGVGRSSDPIPSPPPAADGTDTTAAAASLGASNATSTFDPHRFIAECKEVRILREIKKQGSGHSKAQAPKNTYEAPCSEIKPDKSSGLKPIVIVGKNMLALHDVKARCPAKTAMVSWRFVPDDRPWYDREEGAFSLSPTCCSVGEAGLGLCTTRYSGCAAPAEGVLEGSLEKSTSHTGLPDISHVEPVACDATKNEVLTGWKWTRKGCSGGDHSVAFPKGGSIQIEATCCTLSTKPWELLSKDDAEREGMSDTDAALIDDVIEPGVPEEFEVPQYAPGPLIDVVTVEEGASYLTRADVKDGDWDAMLDAVKKLPGDRNEDRFCVSTVDSTGASDLSDAMQSCPTEIEDELNHDALDDSIMRPERNATYVGCFDGLIDSSMAAPTDIQRYERIQLGAVKRLSLRAPRAFRRCARACAGYPHMITSISLGVFDSGESDLIMECMCSFGLDDYLNGESQNHDEAPDKACAFAAKGNRGPLGWKAHGAVYELPADTSKENVNVTSTEYVGCYSNYAEFEKKSAEFVETFDIQSPPPSPPPPTVGNYVQGGEALKRLRKAGDSSSASASESASASASLGANSRQVNYPPSPVSPPPRPPPPLPPPPPSPPAPPPPSPPPASPSPPPSPAPPPSPPSPSPPPTPPPQPYPPFEPLLYGAYKVVSIPRGRTGTEIFTECTQACSGYKYMSLGMRGEATSYENFPPTSCTCGFRFDEYVKTSYAFTEGQTQETCEHPTTYVGGSSTCVKGPCGYDPVSGEEADISGSEEPEDAASVGSRSGAVELEVDGAAVEVHDDAAASSDLGSPSVEVMMDDSNVVTLEEFNYVTDKVNAAKQLSMWVKCYDTSVDVKNSATWRAKCNNRGATIVFIKTTEGKKIAGYRPKSDGAVSTWMNEPDAAIISITSRKGVRMTKTSWAGQVDKANMGPAWGYDGGTNAGPLWVQNNMATIRCGYWNYNVDYRSAELNEYHGYNQLCGGSSKSIANLEVWALKTPASVTEGGAKSAIASPEDFIRMTAAIKRFVPSKMRSDMGTVTPQPDMWAKCVDTADAADTGGSYLDVIPETGKSKIVNKEELDWVVEGVTNNNGSPLTALVHKCYDVSEHAKTSNEFHTRCDSFGATLTFIELTNGRKIAAFGAHTWAGNAGWRHDTKATLFSVTDRKQSKSKHPQYGMYSHSSYGPCFGGGHDLCVRANMRDIFGNPNSYAPGLAKGDLMGAGIAYIAKLEVWVIREPQLVKCANKGPSVMHVETDKGKRFSIYSPFSFVNYNFDRVGTLLRQGPTYMNTDQAMIYNLVDHSSAYSSVRPMYAVYQSWYRGPAFGGAHDVYFDPEMKKGWCNMMVSSYSFGGMSANSAKTCGGRSFNVKKVEIWYMKTSTTETPAAQKTGDNGVFAADPETGARQSSGIATQREVGVVNFAAGLDTEEGMWVKCFDYKPGGASKPADFHKTCNGKGATMTFGRLGVYGRRFAAYNPVSWTNSGWLPELGSYLYSLDTEKGMHAGKNPRYAVYDQGTYGPTFGNNHDLHVANTGRVTCRMNGAYSTTSYALNDFELCANGQALEAMEVWYRKERETTVSDVLIAEYNSREVKLASRTSEVASGAELAEVGLIVGYQPRANMWKQCFSIAAGDTRTSKTFHEQCDNMVRR